MTAVVRGQALGQALCKVLDLDPCQVQQLTIEMDPAKVVTVTVVHLVTPDQAEGLTHLASQYHLTPRPTPYRRPMATYRSPDGHTTIEPKLGTAGVDLACDNEHGHGWDHHLTPADAHALGRELITLALRAGHRP